VLKYGDRSGLPTADRDRYRQAVRRRVGACRIRLQFRTKTESLNRSPTDDGECRFWPRSFPYPRHDDVAEKVFAWARQIHFHAVAILCSRATVGDDDSDGVAELVADDQDSTFEIAVRTA